MPLSPSAWRVWIEIYFGKLGCEKIESPSAWRVWIEIYTYRPLLSLLAQVTLRMEGVDRNKIVLLQSGKKFLSPSAWRVWIEIRRKLMNPRRIHVTLRMEGVDRNKDLRRVIAQPRTVTLRMEGVDRNASHLLTSLKQ